MFNMSFLEIFAQDPKAKINKKTPHPFNFICLPKFISEEAKAKAK